MRIWCEPFYLVTIGVKSETWKGGHQEMLPYIDQKGNPVDLRPLLVVVRTFLGKSRSLTISFLT